MCRFLLVVIIMVFAMAISITPSSSQETPKETLQETTQSTRKKSPDKSSGYFDFNKDRFLSGTTVVQNKEGVDDLFMVGETVRSEQDITGSAHLAGRKVIITGAIGGDAYVSGIDVTIDGKVSGDITVGGYKVQTAEVDGDLRASGDMLTLSGPVLGYALVSGEDVKFESFVKGDVSLAAKEVDFADDARIEGKLILYEEKEGEIIIPAQVIPEDRIERRDISEWAGADDDAESKSLFSKLVAFLRRVLFFTVMSGLIAVVRPQKLADLRESILRQTALNLLFGFIAVSAGIGAAILLMFSGLGFLLVLASVLIALLGAFAGYVVGTYAIGVALLLWAKRPEPDTTRGRVMAGAAGAFAVTIIAKIPYLGGLSILAVALIGAGALYARLLRPKLMAEG